MADECREHMKEVVVEMRADLGKMPTAKQLSELTDIPVDDCKEILQDLKGTLPPLKKKPKTAAKTKATPEGSLEESQKDDLEEALEAEMDKAEVGEEVTELEPEAMKGEKKSEAAASTMDYHADAQPPMEELETQPCLLSPDVKNQANAAALYKGAGQRPDLASTVVADIPCKGKY